MRKRKGKDLRAVDPMSPEGQLIQEIVSELGMVIEIVTGIEQSEVRLGLSFIDDLDIDSLSMVEISVQVEDALGIKIPIEDLSSLRYIDDVVDYAFKRIRENPSFALQKANDIKPSMVDAIRAYASPGIIHEDIRKARREWHETHPTSDMIRDRELEVFKADIPMIATDAVLRAQMKYIESPDPDLMSSISEVCVPVSDKHLQAALRPESRQLLLDAMKSYDHRASAVSFDNDDETEGIVAVITFDPPLV